MAVNPLNLVDKQDKDTGIVPSRSSPTCRDLSVFICWSKKAEEDGYDTEGDIGPFLLQEGSPEEFVKASLPTKVQEEELHELLDQNKYQKNPAFQQILKEETEGNIDKIITHLSNQKVQWIHQELHLWCLPTQGRQRKSSPTDWQMQ